MILRLENVSAHGIIPYLDGKRLYRISAIDPSIGSCPMKKINDNTFEFEGEFEVREVEREKPLKVFEIYAK